MRTTDKYILFWDGRLSNFYPYDTKMHSVNNVKPLTIKAFGKTFPTSEHLFMYIKAKTFNDEESAQKILKVKRPEQAKLLGRKVKNFDKEIWDKECHDAMFLAVYSKFSQHEDLKKYLLQDKFNDKQFVEGSTYDIIWGIGLHWRDKNADDEKNWRGENKLGKILNEVRELLIKENNNK